MTNEHIFRSIIVSLLLVLGIISAFYRGRAAMARDRISRKEEGVTLMIFTRLFLLSMALGLFAYIIDPHCMYWSTLPFPDWLRWVGLAFGLISALMYFWIFRTLGANVTGSVTIRKQSTLVVSGPYRLVRHPLYSVRLLFLFPAFGLLSASWFVWSAGVMWFTMLAFRTRIEEAKLVDKHGDKYRAYVRCTGRFLPRLARRPA